MSVYDIYGNQITAGNSIPENKYKGKNCLWLGDSISVVDGLGGFDRSKTYPNLVCKALGMTLQNKASSGGNSERMRNILQGGNGYTATDCSNIDYVFIMIGHNCDYGNEGLTNTTVVTSTINDIPTDSTPPSEFPTTYHGNVGSCIEYILTQNPKCNIYLLTPIWSNTVRYIRTTSKATEALKELGDFYGIPVIDLHCESGISQKNASTYTYDGIHPNPDGIARIVDYIINYMRCH